MSWVVKPGVPLGTRKPRTPSSVVRPDDGDVGDRAVGDPHLLAVQDPVVAVAARARAHRAGVASRRRARSGRSSRSPRRRPSAAATPASAPREPQRQIANIASEPCTETSAADAAVAGLELHAGEAVGGGRRAGAAVALEVHAEHAELAELAAPARAGSSPPRTSRRRSATTLSCDEGADACRGCRAPRRRAGGRCRGSRWGGSRAARRRWCVIGEAPRRFDLRRSKICRRRMSRRARRPAHPRLLPRARGAARDDGARRPRRRGDQGRAAGRRRRHPRLGPALRRARRRRPTSSRSTATRTSVALDLRDRGRRAAPASWRAAPTSSSRTSGPA